MNNVTIWKVEYMMTDTAYSSDGLRAEGFAVVDRSIQIACLRTSADDAIDQFRLWAKWHYGEEKAKQIHAIRGVSRVMECQLVMDEEAANADKP